MNNLMEIHYAGHYIRAEITHIATTVSMDRLPEVLVRGFVMEDAFEVDSSFQRQNRLQQRGALAQKINKKFYIATQSIISPESQELGVETWPKATLEEVIEQATKMVNDKNGPETVAIVQIIRTVSRQPTPVKIKKII